mmetsp:Transcript_31984/g.99084  ORF Transcript_31984/g.99084 Transcript_31984/m.99084 type:complete len:247 (-) Transcript_31984:13-753(-)
MDHERGAPGDRHPAHAVRRARRARDGVDRAGVGGVEIVDGGVGGRDAEQAVQRELSDAPEVRHRDGVAGGGRGLEYLDGATRAAGNHRGAVESGPGAPGRGGSADGRDGDRAGDGGRSGRLRRDGRREQPRMRLPGASCPADSAGGLLLLLLLLRRGVGGVNTLHRKDGNAARAGARDEGAAEGRRRAERRHVVREARGRGARVVAGADAGGGPGRADEPEPGAAVGRPREQARRGRRPEDHPGSQ